MLFMKWLDFTETLLLHSPLKKTKTKTNSCRTKPTTLSNKFSHVLTAMFVYVPSVGNFP